VFELKNVRVSGMYSQSRFTVQMKGEYLMLVPETADGFRATIGALISLSEGEGVTFHTFSLPENRCRCLCMLFKNPGKRIAELEIMEELEAKSIQVQVFMQIRSRRRNQDAEKTVHLHHTSYSRWTCGLKWRCTRHRRDCCSANAANTSGTPSITAATHLGEWHAPMPIHPGRMSPQSGSLSAVAMESTALLTIAVAASGRRRLRLLTRASTHPTGVSRSKAVLKIVITFIAEYGSAD
jgi:hypothetical protein